MGAKTQTVQRETAASPLSRDVIRELQGRLSEGAFGTGVGPLQQEAGTAIRQFVNSGPGNLPTLEDMVPGLEAVHRRGVERNAADLREGMGIMGTRLGSSLQTGEGRLRAGMEQDWQAQLSQLANAIASNNLQAQGQHLGAIGMMHGMGDSNIAPFMQMAQMGILPPEIISTPNPWLQLGTGLLGAGGNFLGAGAAARAGRIPMEALAGAFNRDRQVGLPDNWRIPLSF